MSPATILPAQVLEANFAEHKPALSHQEARIEANRCLFCFDAPCIQACPTGIDVPAFIRKIANDNPLGAARTILSANILGASCARVCPTQVLCEGACVLDDRDEQPIQIGRLQRYATDFAEHQGVNVAPRPAKEKSGRTVAILGAGPAGLACAAELARLGHHAVVYEKRPLGGGLNTYGIAYYKMRPEVSLREVELVRSMGVEFRFGIEVGKDLAVDALLAKHDALFIGLGLGNGTKLGIPGEDLPGVRDALDFIEDLHTKPLASLPPPGDVLVIGCGNTAIDAATQAKRLGARSVTIAYRRGEEDMSAYSFEYELAKSDGVQFLFHCVPVFASGSPSLSKVRLARTKVSNGTVSVIPGSEFDLAVDLMLKAVGQEKQSSLLARLFPSLELDRRGVVKVDPLTGKTNLPGIYAGGDCANGGREVVNAVGEGKKAALAIHALFSAPEKPHLQPSRLGAPTGPTGSGLLKPIRAFKGMRSQTPTSPSHG
jgi:glutamate synthase (NADPH/NADH) small chain